ncbi:hypothetical protein BC940DRAFT_316370 [Gongronella butleri]|nr:hypothetical protein BC940DRAFT_316370 [Gongronella butleri]
MDSIDTELAQLALCDQLRANSSFMKVMATLFHYGNQPMNAAQLVIAVRTLQLLPLRGETPKSTIQGIISTSRKTARDLHKADPFCILRDATGRQARYCIADEVLNGVQVPPIKEIPDKPITLHPVHHTSSHIFTPRPAKREKRLPKPKPKRKKPVVKPPVEKEGTPNSDVEIDTDDDDVYGMHPLPVLKPLVPEEETIFNYSLLHAPPAKDDTYIDPIDFVQYPTASHFAIVQQKGYAYPRFRSKERVKIFKVKCEDKYRVADIESGDRVVGRMYILADGHGGPGCAEFFVSHTPKAIQNVCDQFDPAELDHIATQKQFEKLVKQAVETLDHQYLAIKRSQLANPQDDSDDLDNDGCTLIINIFFGRWLVNVNVGDSRSILISAPEPPASLTTPRNTKQTQSSKITNNPNSIANGTTVNHTNHNEDNEKDNDKDMEKDKDKDTFPSPSSSTAPATLEKDAQTLAEDENQEKQANAQDTTPNTDPVAVAAVTPSASGTSLAAGADKHYLMDVVFASQDHKPYLEHLAREILENGGEFVDSVQNRIIKVELSSFKDDGSRQAKRYALKNARIRPSNQYLQQQYQIQQQEIQQQQQQQQQQLQQQQQSNNGFAEKQSAVRSTTADSHQNDSSEQDTPDASHPISNPASNATTNATTQHRPSSFTRRGHVPSLNVARSCGDLDFKMNGQKRIISCEPDVTFLPIADHVPAPASNAQLTDLFAMTTHQSSNHNHARRRHFLFMSTDGTFDYMYEETADRQNRVIAKALGPMIEDGENLAKYLMDQEAASITIKHQPDSPMDIDPPAAPEDQPMTDASTTEKNASTAEKDASTTEKDASTLQNDASIAPGTPMDTSEDTTNDTDVTKATEQTASSPQAVNAAETSTMDAVKTKKEENTDNELSALAAIAAAASDAEASDALAANDKKNEKKDDEQKSPKEEPKEEPAPEPPKPRLIRPLTEQEAKVREAKEKTLAFAARYFANREVNHGFFSSTLQDYDDCTIILVEI